MVSGTNSELDHREAPKRAGQGLHILFLHTATVTVVGALCALAVASHNPCLSHTLPHSCHDVVFLILLLLLFIPIFICTRLALTGLADLVDCVWFRCCCGWGIEGCVGRRRRDGECAWSAAAAQCVGALGCQQECETLGLGAPAGRLGLAVVAHPALLQQLALEVSERSLCKHSPMRLQDAHRETVVWLWAAAQT